MNSLTPLALLISMMIAPHSLALLGNLAGAYQHYFLFWVAAAVCVYWINIRSMSRVSAYLPPGQSPFLSSILKVLLLACRWMTTIMLSAVLLVTAGFAFNETFLYWFPNFAFAFILLGALMFVHLFGRQAAQRVQVLLSATALGGLGLLTAMGIWRAVVAPSEAGAVQDMDMATLPITVLLLFVGFDLALNHDFTKAPTLRKTMNRGIYALAILLGLWGLSSMLVVPAEKLSASFIPHILAARGIGGEFGRLIMGAVVILGSAAAVNALLLSNSDVNAGIFKSPGLNQPPWLKWLKWRTSWVVLAGAVIAILMAVGMAGEEIIDSYVRAGLIIWLFYYGAIHLTLLFKFPSGHMPKSQSKTSWILPAAGAAVMISGGTVLLLKDHEWLAMLKFAGLMLLLTAFLVLGSRPWRRSAQKNERNDRDNRQYRLNE